MTSSPTGLLMPGMTNIRSRIFSIASIRCRTDAGSLPRPGIVRRIFGVGWSMVSVKVFLHSRGSLKPTNV